MIYIVAALLVLISILRITSPKRYAVHASVAQELPPEVKAEGRWSPGFVRDQNGKLMDVTDMFIGRAVRDSMADLGIPDGATFLGTFLSAENRDVLKRGDIVVVDGKAAHSDTGLRLRRIDRIEEDGTVRFLPDSYGRPRRSRPVDEVLARVTHVITSGDSRGFVARLLSHIPAIRRWSTAA